MTPSKSKNVGISRVFGMQELWIWKAENTESP